MRTLTQAAALCGLGLILAALSLAAGGAVAPGDAPQLLAALEAQVPVFLWDVGEVAGRDDLLVVDGRAAAAFAAAHPAGARNVPFEKRGDVSYRLPLDRPVRAVLVVMEDAGRARALAERLARRWALPEVATLKGGWSAWRAAGLPVEK